MPILSNHTGWLKLAFRLLLGGAVLLPAGWALAQSAASSGAGTPPGIVSEEEEEEEDQEKARKALENREILPLGNVLAQIQEKFSGDVVEIELERKAGAWVYEIEIIGVDGRVRDIDVDGKTGDVLNIAFEE
jgi:hypothetical protein